MASSRTGTTRWINNRRRMLAEQRPTGEPCPECRRPFVWDVKLHPQSPEIDHIIPVSHGGTDDRNNLRVVCRQCNQTLGGKLKRPRYAPPETPRAAVQASSIW